MDMSLSSRLRSLQGPWRKPAAALPSTCGRTGVAVGDIHGRLDLLDSGRVLSLSVPPEHLQWVLGVNDRASALKKLEDFKLDGIVQKMTCPFLLLHGAGDEQIPLEIAEKLYEAVGSKQKALKVFTREEGGFHHCQVDDATIGVHYMWDWISDILHAGE